MDLLNGMMIVAVVFMTVTIILGPIIKNLLDGNMDMTSIKWAYPLLALAISATIIMGSYTTIGFLAWIWG